jgi:hypothetical protein
VTEGLFVGSAVVARDFGAALDRGAGVPDDAWGFRVFPRHDHPGRDFLRLLAVPFGAERELMALHLERELGSAVPALVAASTSRTSRWSCGRPWINSSAWTGRKVLTADTQRARPHAATPPRRHPPRRPRLLP